MKTLLAAITFCIASASGAQPMEKWGYPDPGEFAKAALMLCSEQRDSVILSTRYRNEGRSREEVLALVPVNPPSLQLRVVDVYRENIEDVYSFPQYGLYSMMVFRAEVCRKEVMSVRRLPRFDTVHEMIGACETRHGKQRSNELYACVRAIVDGM
jgi:hypothetical protein